MTRAKWSGKIVIAWQRARSSLWFIPSLLVLFAVVLSTALLRIDAALGTSYATSWWLFGGSAEGARTVLSVIAGSLITVVAVAFSVTMIAIQQASTQFTPRVLLNFTSDRSNQVVLGTYIATFTYALLVLRRVRESTEGGSAFVPSIAISTGMLLALVSLGLLVYFIHHVSEVLQVSHLLTAIRRELDGQIRHLFPQALGRGEEEPASLEAMIAEGSGDSAGEEIVVRSDEEGHLRRIDASELSAAASQCVRFVRVEVQIGDYLREGDVLLRAWTGAPPREGFEDRVRGAFQVARDRSIEQDPLFGIRQLVDIGVKALSPGVNDPTTAEQALNLLGGAMSFIIGRSMPSPVRVVDGGVRFLFRAPTFADYVDACFAQIRRAARSELHVSLYLAGVLRSLLDRTTSESRAYHLRRQLEAIYAGYDLESLSDEERGTLRRETWSGPLEMPAAEHAPAH